MQKNNRLEAFTDAAFAFALTLLAISGDQMPESIEELKSALHQVPSFIASAALLIMFWYQHQQWSRTYQTNDMGAVLLTSLLVCTVLIYVYPLKMVFSGFLHWLSAGYLRPSFNAESAADIYSLFTIYAYGYITMCLSMYWLYRHSLKHHMQLNLAKVEVVTAQLQSRSFLLLAFPGFLSLIFSYTMPERWLFLTGMVYSLLGIIMPLYGIYAGRKLKALEE